MGKTAGPETLFEDLLVLTRALRDALQAGRLEEAGRLLRERGELIGTAGDARPPQGGPARRALEETARLDQEAADLLQACRERLRRELRDAGRLRDGLISYAATGHHLPSGQLFNQSR